jgi:hypothetical protein
MSEVHVIFSTQRLEELGKGDWELMHCYSTVVPRVGERVLIFDEPPFNANAPDVRMETLKVRVAELEWQYAAKHNQEATQSAVTVLVVPWDESQVDLFQQWEQRVIDWVSK